MIDIALIIFQWQLINQSPIKSDVGICSPSRTTVLSKCFLTFPAVSPVSKKSFSKVVAIDVSWSSLPCPAYMVCKSFPF